MKGANMKREIISAESGPLAGGLAEAAKSPVVQGFSVDRIGAAIEDSAMFV
jgi:hypothetical protein